MTDASFGIVWLVSFFTFLEFFSSSLVLVSGIEKD